MYIILGWVGWIWLGIVMILLPAGLWIQHLRRRKDWEGEAPSREGEAPSEPSSFRHTREGEAPSREGEAPSEPSFPPLKPTTR
jgi:hypothetical protein